MTNKLTRCVAAGITAAVLCGCFAGCNKQTITDSLDSRENQLIIEVDGKTITIENTQDKTIAQLLEQAEVVVNEGDTLSIPGNQTVDGDMTVRVLRKCKVTVRILDANGNEQAQHTIVLTANTVADALGALDITLSKTQQVTPGMDAALEDGMYIFISTVPEGTLPDETQPDETQPDETQPDETQPDETQPDEPQPTTPSTPSTPTTPTTPSEPSEPTEPTQPSQPEKVIVRIEIYEDCDGSGHGVKVITYSDGTQEEVPF